MKNLIIHRIALIAALALITSVIANCSSKSKMDWAFDQQTKFSAGQVINGRCAERDSEMTDKANGRRDPSHIARMSSKDTSSDTLQDAKRSGTHQAESDERLSKI